MTHRKNWSNNIYKNNHLRNRSRFTSKLYDKRDYFILKFVDVPRSLKIVWCLFVLREYILMLVTSKNEPFDCEVTKTRLSISGIF